MLIVITLILTGCSNTAEISGPPWSKDQVKQMERDGNKTVPLLRVEF
jgi:outer membrane lipoprotein SlyB